MPVPVQQTFVEEPVVKRIEKIVPKNEPIKEQKLALPKPVQKSRVEEIDEVEEKSP